MKTFVKRLLQRVGSSAERGASVIEYALLLGLIAVVCFAAVDFMGGSNAGSLDRSGSSIAEAQD